MSVELSSSVISVEDIIVRDERNRREQKLNNDILSVLAITAAGFFKYSKKYQYGSDAERRMVSILKEYLAQKGPDAFENLVRGLGHERFPKRLRKMNVDRKVVMTNLPLIFQVFHENCVDLVVLLEENNLGILAGYYAAQAVKAGAREDMSEKFNDCVSRMPDASPELIALRDSLCES